MGKIRIIEINEVQRQELESCHRDGKGHAFRTRCQTILLKSEGRSSKEVGDIVKMHQVSVNTWADRYEHEGIKGLLTKPGRGRKPFFNKEQDGAALSEVLKDNRQSIKATKAAYEAARKENGDGNHKMASEETLRRFLKALTADIKE